MALNVPGHRDLRKIVVLNPKGGSGKSTLAVNVAGYLADRGEQVALMDFDPQGSATRWLERRHSSYPAIRGIEAFNLDSSKTRSWQLRVPTDVRYLVVDTPAAMSPKDFIEFTCGVHAILVPVLPSAIDTHAASVVIRDLLLIAKVSRRMGRLGVVANRVRRNTLAYRQLMRFLERLSIEEAGVIRDSQHYVSAAAEGLSIHDLQPSRVRDDLASWAVLAGWLQQRLDTPLTARDYLRPDVESSNEIRRLVDAF